MDARNLFEQSEFVVVELDHLVAAVNAYINKPGNIKKLQKNESGRRDTIFAIMQEVYGLIFSKNVTDLQLEKFQTSIENPTDAAHFEFIGNLLDVYPRANNTIVGANQFNSSIVKIRSLFDPSYQTGIFKKSELRDGILAIIDTYTDSVVQEIESDAIARVLFFETINTQKNKYLAQKIRIQPDSNDRLSQLPSDILNMELFSKLSTPDLAKLAKSSRFFRGTNTSFQANDEVWLDRLKQEMNLNENQIDKIRVGTESNFDIYKRLYKPNNGVLRGSLIIRTKHKEFSPLELVNTNKSVYDYAITTPAETNNNFHDSTRDNFQYFLTMARSCYIVELIFNNRDEVNNFCKSKVGLDLHYLAPYIVTIEGFGFMNGKEKIDVEYIAGQNRQFGQLIERKTSENTLDLAVEQSNIKKPKS